MNPFIVDLEEFAERRSGQRQATENALFGSALYALRQFGQKGWADALIAKAKKKVRADFHDLTGAFTTKALREHVADWEKEVRAALAETHKPTEATIRQQAQTIATMLATSAHNIAMEAAGDVDEATIEKVWVSREDPKVRPTHAAAHGQRVPMSGSFTVGGFKMSRPGDLKAPIQETANCRCVLGLVQSRGAVAASADGPRDGVLIVALPAADDPVTEDSSEDEAHLTTIWFGSTDEAAVDPSVVGPTVERIASTLAPFTAKVERRGTLGDDEADVLFLDADDVRFLREALLADEDILNGMKSVEQYPEWTPHVTLGYPDAPGAERTVAAVKFDRLALWVAQERIEYPLGEVMENENEPDIPAPEHRLDYVDDPIPFWGVLAPEGIPSGDGRMFSTGALRARPLPLPLAYQKTNEPGHDGSYKVGNIEKMWRVPDNTLVYYSGHFLSTVDDVDEIIGIMAESGGMSGVSVDADDGVMELQDAADDSGMELTVFSSARACGATLCNIPAFHEAFCALGSPPDVVVENAIPLSVESLAEQNNPVTIESLSAAGPVKTEDGPGWLTHPVDTDRLRDYWTHGRGAAKIMWGAPGDFNRCRANLAKYVKPQHLSGYCANRHYDALGFWPGDHRRILKHSNDGEIMAPSVRLVASGGTDAPPREWFDDPGLTGPSPIVVTEEGRVFGHLATWDTCHIGFKDACTTPPQSISDYAYFQTGAVLTTDGEVAVGQITIDTGHAGLSLSARPAAAHYDDTGTAVADVCAGEDEHGIYIAGAVRSTATPEQVARLRASALSGDWRTIGGNLELVAALAVNVPGFPIPRTSLAASGGQQTALVAAGIVEVAGQQVERASLEEIVGRAVDERLSADRRKSEMSQIMVKAGRDPRSRMKAIAKNRKG